MTKKELETMKNDPKGTVTGGIITLGDFLETMIDFPEVAIEFHNVDNDSRTHYLMDDYDEITVHFLQCRAEDDVDTYWVESILPIGVYKLRIDFGKLEQE